MRPSTARVAAVAASVSLAIATPARAETVREMYVAAGNYSFLEKIQRPQIRRGQNRGPRARLRRGRRGPHPGAGASGDVRRRPDRSRGSHRASSGSTPTRNPAGQFKEIGPQYHAAVWVSGAERAEVERNTARLESAASSARENPSPSPSYDAPLASSRTPPRTPVASSSPTPSSWRRKPRFDLRRSKTCGGFVQFCADKVCGYVRFAPKCTEATALTSSRSTAPETQACPSSPATTSRSPEDPSEEDERTRGRREEREREEEKES